MAERGRVKNRRGATVRRADQILTLAFGEFPSELLRKKKPNAAGESAALLFDAATSTAELLPAIPVPAFPGTRCNGASRARHPGVWR